MKMVRSANELSSGDRKVCLAIGVFDGVHLGHQQILRQTTADARLHDALAVALTFDRHPGLVVAPQHAPPLIYSPPQKLRAIESLGLDATLTLRFDEAFSKQPGETFIRGLTRDLGKLQSICVGADFVFGHKRSGDVPLLKKLGAELKFTVHGLAAVSVDNQIVSSTRIRAAILAGDLDGAGQMLGRAYAISGRVVKGDHLGQELGFPTANIEVAGLAVPPAGVYAGCATVGRRLFPVALNIGSRPTLGLTHPELRVEAHLLDFEGDLYGQELEVTIGGKLRAEKKFISIEELRSQIAQDIARIRREL